MKLHASRQYHISKGDTETAAFVAKQISEAARLIIFLQRKIRIGNLGDRKKTIRSPNPGCHIEDEFENDFPAQEIHFHSIHNACYKLKMERAFDHEKLGVYQVELQFIAWLTDFFVEVSKSRGAGYRELFDQLDRASLSAVLNTAGCDLSLSSALPSVPGHLMMSKSRTVGSSKMIRRLPVNKLCGRD
jgi:hypothetical protein